jgi:DNA-binding NtrC family response regulator
MESKNIVLFETYEGVRFVLERSLRKFEHTINIHSSHLRSEIEQILRKNDINLLITELNQKNSDGLAVSAFGRQISPDLSIIWITVLGCNLFRQQKKELGNIFCIEKPLAIEDFREKVSQALDIHIHS